MLIYTANKDQFIRDVLRNEIDDRILANMLARGLGRVSPAELASWRNSMQFMKNILDVRDVPDDAGVAIEYVIPQTGKRIDFILTGQNAEARDTALIVELKQWETVDATDKDGIVRTFLGGTQREVPHPSYQAWTYAALLNDFNEAVEVHRINLKACAYLHNCVSDSVQSDFYRDHLERAPSFLKKDTERLRRFILHHVRKGDRNRIIYNIENGRIRPSKSLADHLASLLKGNREFLMIDDQKLVYETALEVSAIGQSGHKQVLIVEGGPGTGKSVVAINLLVELIQRGLIAHYVTRNAAPRAVYETKLTGSFRRSHIGNLLKGSGAYHDVPVNSMDVLIVDEAHRLNERSGMFQNLGINQVMEIIRASRTSIFFLDEDQRVTWKDIGSRQEIEHWARSEDATVHRAVLRSQFRCNGSDGYLAWLDQALQIRDTANPDLDDLGYAVEVIDSPTELHDRIRSLNKSTNRARLVAGYCWDWISKKDPKKLDIEFPEHGFAMRWNLDKDGPLWIMQPDSVNEIGCIHTCQGLELDYVGVIIGPDLIARNGRLIAQPEERSRMDSSIKGYKTARKKNAIEADAKATAIIKNTYRTLMSRGTKGCLIWSCDAETNEYFRALLKQCHQPPINLQQEAGNIPFRIIPEGEVQPFVNAVPLFDFYAAAGDFSEHQSVSDYQWVELPSYISPSPGMFVLQVIGESMNRRVPSGSWCLFEAPHGGTRQGKTVLVQHRNIQDPDTGVSFTIKRYESSKRSDPDTEWQHTRIILHPDSYDTGYQPIVLEGETINELRVVGILKAVLQ
jgi:uncharacterized protein